MRVGIGYDVHALCEGRDLILGGVKVEHSVGLMGHSDADVLVHAIMDAMLGAAALGDIGRHFPDNDDSYKNIDSMLLLDKVNNLLLEKGFSVNNIDAVIIAQKPKLMPYIDTMKNNIATLLKIDKDRVNIKATTTEKLGFEGRQEGISSQAVCTLRNTGLEPHTV